MSNGEKEQDLFSEIVARKAEAQGIPVSRLLLQWDQFFHPERYQVIPKPINSGESESLRLDNDKSE